jgi:hypothetical protein
MVMAFLKLVLRIRIITYSTIHQLNSFMFIILLPLILIYTIKSMFLNLYEEYQYHPHFFFI